MARARFNTHRTNEPNAVGLELLALKTERKIDDSFCISSGVGLVYTEDLNSKVALIPLDDAKQIASVARALRVAPRYLVGLQLDYDRSIGIEPPTRAELKNLIAKADAEFARRDSRADIRTAMSENGKRAKARYEKTSGWSHREQPREMQHHPR